MWKNVLFMEGTKQADIFCWMPFIALLLSLYSLAPQNNVKMVNFALSIVIH